MDSTQRPEGAGGHAEAAPDNQAPSQGPTTSPETPVVAHADRDPSLGQDLDLPSRTDAEPAPTGAGGEKPGADTGTAEDDGNRRARDVAEQLKPVAIAAEEIASKAIELSTKGLARLSEILEQRRQERAAKGEQPPPSKDDA